MLLIPIKPEPASRIRSGRKWFELRKTRPPGYGTVYLLETRDRQAVNAIRTCIHTGPHISLPLEELWKRVGDYATSREKFDSYFGGKYKYGVAIPIRETQLLSEPVTPEELASLDPNFKLPAWPWTYYEIDDSSPAARRLESAGRARVMRAPPGASMDPDEDSMSVRLLDQGEYQYFADQYGQFVKPYYADSDDYADFVISSHQAEVDPYGYLTTRKQVWGFILDGATVGFTVATQKRGGSVKFGPTVVHPSFRGQHLGTNFRLLVEAQYPHARKFYNTLPAGSDAALKYVLEAGYVIEAHLRNQYNRSSDDLVVGKLTSEPRTPIAKVVDSPSVESLTATFSEGDSVAMIRLIGRHYDEIDESFARSVEAGTARDWNDLSKKPKRVLVTRENGGTIDACLIATPKRGGAIKLSPFVVDKEATVGGAIRLLESAIARLTAENPRKFYMHVPIGHSQVVAAAQRLGFAAEGILREPYLAEVDCFVFGLVIR